MTAYFDTMTSKLAGLSVDPFDHEGHREWERQIVHACTVAAAWPIRPMPQDLADAVHRTILAGSIETRVTNAPPADFETEQEHHAMLSKLVWDLHTCFHEISRWADAERAAGRDTSFTDDPTYPVRVASAAGEQRQEELVPRLPFLVAYGSARASTGHPQRVYAETPFLVANRVAKDWAPGSIHQLHVWPEPADSMPGVEHWKRPRPGVRILHVTKDEYGDIFTRPHEAWMDPPKPAEVPILKPAAIEWHHKG